MMMMKWRLMMRLLLRWWWWRTTVMEARRSDEWRWWTLFGSNSCFCFSGGEVVSISGEVVSVYGDGFRRGCERDGRFRCWLIFTFWLSFTFWGLMEAGEAIMLGPCLMGWTYAPCISHFLMHDNHTPCILYFCHISSSSLYFPIYITPSLNITRYNFLK